MHICNSQDLESSHVENFPIAASDGAAISYGHDAEHDPSYRPHGLPPDTLIPPDRAQGIAQPDVSTELIAGNDPESPVTRQAVPGSPGPFRGPSVSELSYSRRNSAIRPIVFRTAIPRSGPERKNCLSRLAVAGPQDLPSSGAKGDAKNGIPFGRQNNSLIRLGFLQSCGSQDIVPRDKRANFGRIT